MRAETLRWKSTLWHLISELIDMRRTFNLGGILTWLFDTCPRENVEPAPTAYNPATRLEISQSITRVAILLVMHWLRFLSIGHLTRE